MPVRFKAAVLEEIDQPLALCEVETTELKVGQVLVKVLVSGLCGSQLLEIRGYKGNRRFLPHLMGHEGCGLVQEVGPGVTKVKPGSKVVMHWRMGSGIEAPFPQYLLHGKLISSGKVTTLNQFAIVSENRLTPVPADTPDELCAMLGCSMTTAFGILNHEIHVQFGESVAVVGCGGVGLNLIQGAALRSASPIIAIDNNANKESLSLAMGADLFVNTSVESLDTALERHAPEGIDLMIDTTGNPAVLKQLFGHLSSQGRLVMVGQPPPGVSLEIPDSVSLFQGRGKSLQATQGGQTNPDSDIPRLIKLAPKLQIGRVVTHRFSLDQVNEAFDLLRTGNAGRIMIYNFGVEQ